MFAVVGRRLVAGGLELLEADEVGVWVTCRASASMSINPCSAVEILARGGWSEYFDAGAIAGGQVDVARRETVFLDELERLTGGGGFLCAEAQFFDDSDVAPGRFVNSSC